MILRTVLLALIMCVTGCTTAPINPAHDTQWSDNVEETIDACEALVWLLTDDADTQVKMVSRCLLDMGVVI